MKKLLIIEDEINMIDMIKVYFKKKGWNITTSMNGRDGIKQIKYNQEDPFDCILLDWMMPIMNGEEFLKIINQTYNSFPPVVVFSSYLDDERIFYKCKELNVKYLIQKPIHPPILETIINGIIEKNIDEIYYNLRLKNNLIKVNPGEIDKTVKNHEKKIINYFSDSIKVKFNVDYEEPEPLLLIGRRWNSWYPAYFNIPGGAYVIISPISIHNRKHSAIIDPGFKTLSIIQKLGVSLNEIDACLITHNHPDHIGGIFELLACNNTLDKTIDLFCSPSVNDFFKNYSGKFINVQRLSENELPFMEYNISDNISQKISVKSFDTFHREIGNIDESCGLVLLSRTIENNNDFNEIPHKTIILGDTTYNPAEHYDKFINIIAENNTRIAILHIGCSQLKQKIGKHLYFIGLEHLLQDINSKLRKINYNGKLLVLISEWGLEHASRDQMRLICNDIADDFNPESPIKETIRLLLKNNFDKINLIPADIGLLIGMNSGMIYLEKNNKIRKYTPNEIDFDVNNDGIYYFPKNNS